MSFPTSPIQVNLPIKLANNPSNPKNAPPLYIQPNRKLEVDKTIQLFNSTEKPSTMAALPLELDHDNQTIRVIDMIFDEAIEQYQQEFINATAGDLTIALSTRDTSEDFHYAVTSGASRLAAKTPNIPVVKLIVAPFLLLIGGVWGTVKQGSFVEEKIRQERSVNRDKWFSDVIVKETVRTKQSIKIIKTRAQTIQNEIEEMDEDLIDEKLFEELKILNQFMKFFSPHTPLMLTDKSTNQSVPVEEYLQKKQIEEKEIEEET